MGSAALGEWNQRGHREFGRIGAPILEGVPGRLLSRRPRIHGAVRFKLPETPQPIEEKSQEKSL